MRYITNRCWAEAQLTASGGQDRLSGGDRDEERIGANRRREDIADFYNSARGAGIASTETIPQMQNRVLAGPADSVRVTHGTKVLSMNAASAPLAKRRIFTD
ncbi:MAG: hypothetical protein ACKV2U_10220 [Bryobacteraceae bacterium]